MGIASFQPRPSPSLSHIRLYKLSFTHSALVRKAQPQTTNHWVWIDWSAVKGRCARLQCGALFLAPQLINYLSNLSPSISPSRRRNFPSLLLHRTLLRRPSSDIITQLTRELRLQQQSLLSSSDISSSSPMGSGSQINIAAASAAPQTSTTAAKTTPGQKAAKAGTAGTSRTSTSSGYKSDNSVGSESASRNTLATAGPTG